MRLARTSPASKQCGSFVKQLRTQAQESLKIPNNLLEEVRELSQLLLLLLGKCRDCVRQRFHPAPAPLLQNLRSLCCSFEAHASPVFCLSPAHQARPHEARDDATHGRGADLLNFGEFAQRSGTPAKDQYR